MEFINESLAGSWYPGTEKECIDDIKSYLDDKETKIPQGEFDACVVPHAGWYFSGSIACNTIGALKGSSDPDVIIIMGKHLRPSDSASIVLNGTFKTPIGDLEISERFASELNKKLDLHVEQASRYRPENTIELQLPFVKYFFKNSKIVTIGVPPSIKAISIGKAIVQTSRELNCSIKLIASTDLTHYGPSYGFEPVGRGKDSVEWVKNVNDRRFVEILKEGDPETLLEEALNNSNACCPGSAAALTSAVQEKGYSKGLVVRYLTSYDKNPSDSFVGYVGVVFQLI